MGDFLENVGDFLENVGGFLKNVGDFLENVGVFSKNVGVFFLNNGALFLSDGRLSNGHGTFRYNTLPRKSLLMESLVRKHESPLKKCCKPLPSRGRAHAHHCNLCLFAFTSFTDFRITLFVSSRNKYFSDIF